MTDKREEQRKTATWPRIGVSEIRSGLGGAYKDEPGTDTSTNVIDKGEADFAKNQMGLYQENMILQNLSY